MPDLSQFGWNVGARRYVNLATGRFVSLADVRAAVDTVIDATTQDVRKLSQELVDGQLTVASWQSQMQATLKSLYVACGVAAGGGFAQMSQASYGYLGSLIKPQYQYLNKFAQDIASGTQSLDGSLVARAALYAQAARGIFEAMAMEMAKENGATQAKSVLALADHCPGCLQQAAKGWQAIDAVVPIGSRDCLSNDRCTLIFR